MISLSKFRLFPVWLSAMTLFFSGCGSLPKDYAKSPSHALSDTHDTRLASSVIPLISQHFDKSGFYPLGSGLDAFIARVALIDAAERSLDLQYYIWHVDDTGLILIQRIIAAADRGVRVRLLLDDLDTAGKEIGLQTLNTHPNIEVRLFNPFVYRQARLFDFVTDLKRINRRMHNKSLTADNQITIIGGRNIGNEYFEAAGEAVFADLDVLSIGKVVKQVSSAFDLYWNSDWSFPVSAFVDGPVVESEFQIVREYLDRQLRQLSGSDFAVALRKADFSQRLHRGELDIFWGSARLVYDAPEKILAETVSDETHIGPQMFSYIDQVEDELIVITPYFVPNDRLVNYFGRLVSRGVRVRILTNSLASNDVTLVHAGYRRYRKSLLQKGVELYEFKHSALSQNPSPSGRWSGSSRASLHAKVFGVDRLGIFIGSFNLDPRSIKLNTEMGVWFKSKDLGVQLGDRFDHSLNESAYRLVLDGSSLKWLGMENGQQVQFTTDPHTSWWKRFSNWLLSLVVIESML
ncbi:MAG: phospholipase D family protein [Candidatus Thiodiazotropha sp. (ex Monitilora ramsayi)]|nr:phospholipase D family protein [Candidatus Thiodiazotropha sp. (ex Monitilora ramsayi)]